MINNFFSYPFMYIYCYLFLSCLKYFQLAVIAYLQLFPFREGCAMVDLWDVEDPENKHNENVCQKLVQNPYPFRTVFRNSVYSVLSL